MNIKNYKYFIIIYITGVLSLFPAYAFCGQNKNIAMVVSKKIRPYMDVVAGITEGLEEKVKISQVFFLSENNEKIALKLAKGSFDLLAAIGPEATELVYGDAIKRTDLTPITGTGPITGTDLNLSPKKLYTAVLDPDRILGTDLITGTDPITGTDLNLSSKNVNLSPKNACGISLRIPVEIQVHEISKAFTNLKRIGLLFDARNNDWFYEKAFIAAQQYNITIIPLAVESKNQITQILSENWKNMDCVWMIPDRTVISEKIIQYIIKLGIYHKTGIIGYNSFFISSGAVFSFDFDYKALGIQTARKIETYFKTGECEQEPPEFQTLINRKMVNKIKKIR